MFRTKTHLLLTSFLIFHKLYKIPIPFYRIPSFSKYLKFTFTFFRNSLLPVKVFRVNFHKENILLDKFFWSHCRLLLNQNRHLRSITHSCARVKIFLHISLRRENSFTQNSTEAGTDSFLYDSVDMPAFREL